MAYATDTTVSVEKSRRELESILSRYGATKFGYMSDESRAIIAFQAHGKYVKFVLPLPLIEDFAKDGRGAKRGMAVRVKAREKACRSRWRALCLCVKAKLEAVECGIASFETEFLAHFVMPGGKTFGEIAIPQIEEATRSGKMPQLQLMS